jgi:hypothetical protein
MLTSTIGAMRLRNQHISLRTARTPAEVVAHMGAMQAQDYAGALWSVGLRMADDGGATAADVERSIDDRSIIRTWPMRRTLHFVAAQDVHWMLALLAPRALAQAEGRRRELEVDDAALAQSRDALTAALQGGRQRSREELFSVLEAAGVRTEGQRGYHILVNLAQSGLLCYASRDGKQATFALLDECVPPRSLPDMEGALATLATRYFVSHGPATVHDFAWWAGLTVGDARKGAAAAGDALERMTVEGRDYLLGSGALDARPDDAASERLFLLPGFDEFLLGYADRGAVLEPAHAQRLHPGANGVFKPHMVLDGRVAGLWMRKVKARVVEVTAQPFDGLDERARRAFEGQAQRYGAFLGLPAAVK